MYPIEKGGAVLDCSPDPVVGAPTWEIHSIAADCEFPRDKPNALTWLSVNFAEGCAVGREAVPR